MPPDDEDHWLARPRTIRALWLLLYAVLALLIVAGIAYPHHTLFGLDGTFAFAAWFGFLSCVVLVAAAKALALIVKRPDTYYDD